MTANIQIAEDEDMYMSRQHAFTIIEILVALSILALIMAAVFGSYTATTTAIERCKPKSLLGQEARLLLQRMTCEFRCCYTGRQDKSSEILTERMLGEEIVEQEKTPLFLGKDISSDQTFLQFLTSTATLKSNYSVSGLLRVSYRMDESGTTLLRNEHEYVGGFENDKNDEDWLPMISDVKDIVFEYYDGQKWLDEWDSNKMNGLPHAVRTSLVMENEDAGPLSFMSCARITCCGYQLSKGTIQKATTSNGDSL